jgi:hypothetical protein
MGNRSKSTPQRRQAILDMLQRGCGFEQAARGAGIGGATLRDWRRDDPAFNAACEAAADFIGDVAESELLNRGLKGSDLALICWLRAHRPHLYNRKMMVALGGDADNPISVEHQHDHQHMIENRVRLVILPDNRRPAMTDEQIAAERELIARENLIECDSDNFIAVDDSHDTDDADAAGDAA